MLWYDIDSIIVLSENGTEWYVSSEGIFLTRVQRCSTCFRVVSFCFCVQFTFVFIIWMNCPNTYLSAIITAAHIDHFLFILSAFAAVKLNVIKKKKHTFFVSESTIFQVTLERPLSENVDVSNRLSFSASTKIVFYSFLDRVDHVVSCCILFKNILQKYQFIKHNL